VQGGGGTERQFVDVEQNQEQQQRHEEDEN
jgi:hypothetical protein